MTQKRSYKQYPKEFKDEAVALVLEQGYSVPEAAKSLGIGANMLYKWKELHELQISGKALICTPNPGHSFKVETIKRGHHEEDSSVQKIDNETPF